jgi:hypothetical protein
MFPLNLRVELSPVCKPSVNVHLAFIITYCIYIVIYPFSVYFGSASLITTTAGTKHRTNASVCHTDIVEQTICLLVHLVILTVLCSNTSGPRSPYAPYTSCAVAMNNW